MTLFLFPNYANILCFELITHGDHHHQSPQSAYLSMALNVLIFSAWAARNHPTGNTTAISD